MTARSPAKPAVTSSADVLAPTFGSNARVLRSRRRMTLDQLSAETGLSKGHLSRFERDEKTLSIAALMRVSHALGVSVAALLGQGASDQPFHLVRAGEGAARSAPADEGPYAYTALSRADGGALSAFMVDLAADASRTSEVAHAGEEAFLVLSGRVEVDLGDDRLVLEAGDYLEFSGALRHRVRSVGRDSRLFIVVAGH